MALFPINIVNQFNIGIQLAVLSSGINQALAQLNLAIV